MQIARAYVARVKTALDRHQDFLSVLKDFNFLKSDTTRPDSTNERVRAALRGDAALLHDLQIFPPSVRRGMAAAWDATRQS
jgi:hypothetical protein